MSKQAIGSNKFQSYPCLLKSQVSIRSTQPLRAFPVISDRYQNLPCQLDRPFVLAHARESHDQGID